MPLIVPYDFHPHGHLGVDDDGDGDDEEDDDDGDDWLWLDYSPRNFGFLLSPLLLQHAMFRARPSQKFSGCLAIDQAGSLARYGCDIGSLLFFRTSATGRRLKNITLGRIHGPVSHEPKPTAQTIKIRLSLKTSLQTQALDSSSLYVLEKKPMPFRLLAAR